MLGEHADNLLPRGKGLHRLKFFTKHVCGVFQPDDEVGDVAFHHLLLLEHILNAGVFNIEINVADRLFAFGKFFQNNAGLLQLGLHVRDDLLRLFNFRIKILQRRHIGKTPRSAHQTLSLV